MNSFRADREFRVTSRIARGPLPGGGASLSRPMTMVGSLRGAPVVDEDSRPIEQACLEVLQRLLCP